MGDPVLIGREIEDELADSVENWLWGVPGSGKERAAAVFEACAEIIDWKNPEPLPEHLTPDPPPGMRYWLER
jgi:hypothetical protein